MGEEKTVAAVSWSDLLGRLTQCASMLRALEQSRAVVYMPMYPGEAGLLGSLVWKAMVSDLQREDSEQHSSS